MYLRFLFIGLMISVFSSCNSEEGNILVKNIADFNQAIQQLQPGDNLVLANGVWQDVELKFTGHGTEEAPIHLMAETPGRVIISGKSNLRISGEYLVVSGLVFKNGYTPTSEVISFKTGKEKLANHTRVTNCVIDNFSQPERFDGDTWVAMYGKNNQFDHNTLIGKGNRGVTLAVKLGTEASRENNHIIEQNYFGPRSSLGSNGGETLRIGTSHYSRTYSNTVIRNNYFDRTSGELEIISSKSCGNKIYNNVFFESQGTLTMRHGHHTLVENNYFIGNRKPNTGGIRIINEYQTVRKNYLSGLTGHRFRSALVIMNGVPNSPINRYNQVIDSYMDNNIVINSNYIQLCAGSDEERSATPVGSSFKNNLILGSVNPEPFKIYDDVSGIEFTGNVINDIIQVPLKKGFEKVAFSLTKNEQNLEVPSQRLLDQIDFGEVKLPVHKREVGASYYSKTETKTLNSGKKIQVPAGENTLLEALNNSQAGDVLELIQGEEYLMTKYAVINYPISIVTPEGSKARIFSEKQSFFILENGGEIHLENVTIDGSNSPDQAGNNVISTSKYSMNQNYAVIIKDCEVVGLDKNHSFDFLKSYKHTFADSVHIINTQMSNVTGAVMTMDMEVEDLGIYNVENVKIINSTFKDVKHEIANIYRGGTDESTFGPIVTIADVEVISSGKGKRNQAEASFRFHGVQFLDVDNLKIRDSEGIDLFMTNGEPITKLSNITFINSSGLKTNEETFESENIQTQ